MIVSISTIQNVTYSHHTYSSVVTAAVFSAVILKMNYTITFRSLIRFHKPKCLPECDEMSYSYQVTVLALTLNRPVYAKLVSAHPALCDCCQLFCIRKSHQIFNMFNSLPVSQLTETLAYVSSILW